jgi:hypothetical protein
MLLSRHHHSHHLVLHAQEQDLEADRARQMPQYRCHDDRFGSPQYVFRHLPVDSPIVSGMGIAAIKEEEGGRVEYLHFRHHVRPPFRGESTHPFRTDTKTCSTCVCSIFRMAVTVHFVDTNELILPPQAALWA